MAKLKLVTGHTADRKESSVRGSEGSHEGRRPARSKAGMSG